MGSLAVLLAALCFGTTGTARALGPDGVSAASVGSARILIGGGVLAVIAGIALLRERRTLLPRSVVRRGLPSWLVVAIGAVGVVGYQPAFFAGTSANGVAVGTVIALGSAPVATGALEWLVHRRFPGRSWLIATAIATTGVAILGWSANPSPGPGSSPLGVLASLGAGTAYAVYTLAAKELLERGWSPNRSMGAVFGLAAVASIPLLLATDVAWLATRDGLVMALWLGLVTTTIAYVLFARGLARLPAATVSTLTLAEPLTATLFGLLLLHETLSPGAAIGLIVLAAGILYLTLAARRVHDPSAHRPRSTASAQPAGSGPDGI